MANPPAVRHIPLDKLVPSPTNVRARSCLRADTGHVILVGIVASLPHQFGGTF